MATQILILLLITAYQNLTTSPQHWMLIDLISYVCSEPYYPVHCHQVINHYHKLVKLRIYFQNKLSFTNTGK